MIVRLLRMNRKKFLKYNRKWYQRNKEKISQQNRLRQKIWDDLSEKQKLRLINEESKKSLNKYAVEKNEN